MIRLNTVAVLIGLSTILLVSQQTSAFTLSFGPIANDQSVLPASEHSDIPTPQLIRIAIDPSGATVGAISPTDGFRSSEPALRLQRQRQTPVSEPSAPQYQASQQDRPIGAAHQLSGAELLLLRKTSVVADQRGN